ncbi:UDP-glucose 4-epimerase-like isoform X2 [Athalia rosae]|uniref:UDP-glucose 4-epimerase-like isoform X2 n=1 Tax=Athalia rosae TaxID=37344 RepID=UPI0020345D62|nr:UDP-glucose 4-epimerase-like isoform X2 [Athalia rosae]
MLASRELRKNNLPHASSQQKPECLLRVEELTKKHVAFHSVDITNKEELNSVFQKYKFDNVIHFAALKAVGESVAKPLDYYKVNVTGTILLLEVMREHGVYRMIYSSSATVYGLPDKLPLTEESRTGNCTNPYGKSKYMVEQILQDLCFSNKAWSITSLRYFNPVGAHASGNIGEDPNGVPNNLMPYIAQVAVGKREKLSVYGKDYDTPDGTGVRDYIHVTDLAVGHLQAIFHQKPSGFQIYNLGTGRGYSVLEVIEAFKAASGKDIPYEIVDRRPGDIATSYADASRANKELAWHASRNIDDMCKDTWRWQQKNPDGYKNSSSVICPGACSLDSKKRAV